MKRWKKAMVVSLVACTLALPGLASAEEMMAKKFNYSGIETMMKDGTELVPLREIAESLGFKVTWNGENRSVTLTKMMMEDKEMMDDKKMEDKTKNESMMKMGNTFVIQIDNKAIKVDMMDEMLMFAPTILNDKTYVPKELVDTYLIK
ncbi:copper amine oxidase N-terminal domain-containing protein [Paenibacillus alginolyticus]|uniref:Copper amine oxidase N-terminal domain-containing protein n=1 Tax=Paenibacillus alginolyticus TaxID=59839 RepID=A0ABT4GL46_9BACL|nr:copper amine oxidase N-terminal domain-containing protein [Paenibacillus alginolyticus]MCY9669167.1 copper amine oxidase N-terminal domain-containing protein [Paenibacillus alginolyticus]MCY9696922.1 copper amine oxidase N-terminal domain-containing protein [Paenibacillus alginolyticus]MEC0145518.1 copper amine oxidase N-terminal domain-containing protein [Paenibacillus alginolyticus]